MSLGEGFSMEVPAEGHRGLSGNFFEVMGWQSWRVKLESLCFFFLNIKILFIYF